GRAARQRTPVGVPWACVAWASRLVPIPHGSHRTLRRTRSPRAWLCASVPRRRSAFGFGVGEPAEELRVERLRTLLVRKVPRPFDELPPVRGRHVAAGALGA